MTCPTRTLLVIFTLNTNLKKCLESMFNDVLVVMTIIWFLVFVCFCRGASSTVRRCIEKETGQEFAAKIIDVSDPEDSQGLSILKSSHREVFILRLVAGHNYISKTLQFI